jgi:hypothetical protein
VSVLSDSDGETPVAPADFVASVLGGSDEGPAFTDLPDEAVLTGPHYSVRVLGTATMARLDPGPAHVASPDTADPVRLPLLPGQGKEFLLIRVGDVTVGEGARIAVHLTVAGQSRPLPRQVLTLDETTVVTVPAGTEPVLVVTEEDRSQSLSLRTGRRGSDAIAGYYPKRTGRADFAEIASVGDAPNALEAIITVNCTVGPLPFATGRGWAPEGKLWLVAACRAAASGWGAETYLKDARIDLGRTLTARDAGGASLGEFQSVHVGLTDEPEQTTLLVPADLAAVRLSARTVGAWHIATPAKDVTVTFG